SSLQEQASGLSQVVSVFRLDNEAPRQPGAAQRGAGPVRHAARKQPQPPRAQQAIAAPKLATASGEWETF
ncbi:MAG: methyl-accepting chemotaxis protein, partial [Polaromonas sp.]